MPFKNLCVCCVSVMYAVALRTRPCEASFKYCTTPGGCWSNSLGTYKVVTSHVCAAKSCLESLASPARLRFDSPRCSLYITYPFSATINKSGRVSRTVRCCAARSALAHPQNHVGDEKKGPGRPTKKVRRTRSRFDASSCNSKCVQLGGVLAHTIHNLHRLLQ